jgi:hypothetical protein
MPVFFVLKGFSSNKHGDEEKIQEKKGTVGVTQICYIPIQNQVAVLNPFIDKISITYKISDNDGKRAIIEALMGAVEEKGPFTAAPTFKSGKTTYKASVHLIVPPHGHKVLIQVGPKKQKGLTHNFRMEFNPRALGVEGIAFLKSQLEDLVIGALSYGHILFHGTVTGIDIAVDLVGVRIDDLDIRIGPPGKSHWYFSSTGQAETGYLGMKKSGNAPWKAYNKRKHLKEVGGGDPQEQLYGGLSHTRIEYHAKPMKPFVQLGKIGNPFASISLAYPRTPKGVKPHLWQFFLDACQRRGEKAALALMPEGPLRKRYAKTLQAAHEEFWKPKLIWNAWDKALVQSGLVQ